MGKSGNLSGLNSFCFGILGWDHSNIHPELSNQICHPNVCFQRSRRKLGVFPIMPESWRFSNYLLQFNSVIIWPSNNEWNKELTSDSEFFTPELTETAQQPQKEESLKKAVSNSAEVFSWLFFSVQLLPVWFSSQFIALHRPPVMITLLPQFFFHHLTSQPGNTSFWKDPPALRLFDQPHLLSLVVWEGSHSSRSYWGRASWVIR